MKSVNGKLFENSQRGSNGAFFFFFSTILIKMLKGNISTGLSEEELTEKPEKEKLEKEVQEKKIR